MSCKLCDRMARFPEDPLLVAELEHSVLFVGDHQYYPGYCMLVSKSHAREPFELPGDARIGMMSELLACAEALQAELKPLKINYSCLGNVVAHVHWHLIPRRESEAEKLSAPVFGPLDQPPLQGHRTRPEQASELASRLRARLKRP